MRECGHMFDCILRGLASLTRVSAVTRSASTHQTACPQAGGSYALCVPLSCGGGQRSVRGEAVVILGPAD